MIEFFFDIGSSYSYLAATQMAGFSQRTKTPVRWRPFLLGAVFKATGNDLPIKVPAKAKWMLADMNMWAAHYKLPFKMPPRFPMVTLRTQRFLTALDEQHVEPVATALFRAYWEQGEDVTTDPVLAAAAKGAGVDPDPVIAAIDQQANKDKLRETTDEAVRRGAFGAPTFFVGDAMFWGHDRLPLLEAHLASRAR